MNFASLEGISSGEAFFIEAFSKFIPSCCLLFRRNAQVLRIPLANGHIHKVLARLRGGTPCIGIGFASSWNQFWKSLCCLRTCGEYARSGAKTHLDRQKALSCIGVSAPKRASSAPLRLRIVVGHYITDRRAPLWNRFRIILKSILGKSIFFWRLLGQLCIF